MGRSGRNNYETRNSLIEHGQYNLLEQWITAIPADIRGANPWLIYWHGISRIPFNPPLAIELLENAFMLFKEHRDSTGMFMSLYVILNTCPHLAADFKTLNRRLPVLNEVIAEYGYPSDKNIEVLLVSSIVSALVFGAPLFTELMLWIQRGYKLLRETPDIPLKFKIQIMTGLAFHEYSSGNFAKAQFIIDMFPEIEKDKTALPLDTLMLNWIRLVFLQFTGTYEDCLRIANYSLNLSKESGVHIFDMQIMSNVLP